MQGGESGSTAEEGRDRCRSARLRRARAPRWRGGRLAPGGLCARSPPGAIKASPPAAARASSRREKPIRQVTSSSRITADMDPETCTCPTGELLPHPAAQRAPLLTKNAMPDIFAQGHLGKGIPISHFEPREGWVWLYPKEQRLAPHLLPFGLAPPRVSTQDLFLWHLPL